jgi:hypothetical protein
MRGGAGQGLQDPADEGFHLPGSARGIKMQAISHRRTMGDRRYPCGEQKY